MPTDTRIIPEGAITVADEHCIVCGKKIEQMIFRGSGVCGERDRKIRDDVPTGDTGVNGWYKTLAQNLGNHLQHEVRFTLMDPFTLYEGRIGHVAWGEENEAVEIVLEPEYRWWSTSDLHRDSKAEGNLGETPFGTMLAGRKTIEVRRCRP